MTRLQVVVHRNLEKLDHKTYLNYLVFAKLSQAQAEAKASAWYMQYGLAYMQYGLGYMQCGLGYIQYWLGVQ